MSDKKNDQEDTPYDTLLGNTDKQTIDNNDKEELAMDNDSDWDKPAASRESAIVHRGKLDIYEGLSEMPGYEEVSNTEKSLPEASSGEDIRDALASASEVNIPHQSVVGAEDTGIDVKNDVVASESELKTEEKSARVIKDDINDGEKLKNFSESMHGDENEANSITGVLVEVHESEECVGTEDEENQLENSEVDSDNENETKVSELPSDMVEDKKKYPDAKKASESIEKSDIENDANISDGDNSREVEHVLEDDPESAPSVTDPIETQENDDIVSKSNDTDSDPDKVIAATDSDLQAAGRGNAADEAEGMDPKPKLDHENKVVATDSEKTEVEIVTDISVSFGKFLKIRKSVKPISHWVFQEGGKNEALHDLIGGHDGTILHHIRDISDVKEDLEEDDLRDEYIEIKHTPDLKPESGTLTLWYNHEEISLAAALVSCDSSDLSVNGGFNLRTHNGVVTFGLEDGQDKVHRISGGRIIEGEWAQVSISWGQYGMFLYINGVEVSSNQHFKRGLRKNHNDWVLGASRAGSTWLPGKENVIIDEAEFFRGSIDDVALYDQQLNHVEMNILYELGVEDFMSSEEADIIEVPIQVDLSLARPHSLGSAAIFVSGLPETVELSAGRDDGDGNLLLYYDNLNGLKMWTSDRNIEFSIGLTVMSKEEEVLKTMVDVKVSDLEELQFE